MSTKLILLFFILSPLSYSFSEDYIKRECSEVLRLFLLNKSIKEKRKNFILQYDEALNYYQDIPNDNRKVQSFKRKILTPAASQWQFPELIALLDSLPRNENINSFKEQVLAIGHHNLKVYPKGSKKIYFSSTAPFLELNPPTAVRGRILEFSPIEGFIGDEQLFSLIESLANSLAELQLHYTPLPWEQSALDYQQSINQLIFKFNNSIQLFTSPSVLSEITVRNFHSPLINKKLQWWSVNFLRSALLVLTGYLIVDNIKILVGLPQKLKAFDAIDKGYNKSRKEYPDGKIIIRDDPLTRCQSINKWMTFYQKRMQRKKNNENQNRYNFSRKRYLHFNLKFIEAACQEIIEKSSSQLI